MGYFSNGSDNDYYQNLYCNHCQNMRDRGDGRGEGCAVMDLHWLWNYDAVGKQSDLTKKTGLSMFIPRDKNGFNAECSMFLRKPHEQLR